jgi:hypothetical protein
LSIKLPGCDIYVTVYRADPCFIEARSDLQHIRGFGATIVVRFGLIDTRMKILLATFFLALFSLQAFPQSKAALEGEYKLQERFDIMKDKAETFNDYKVVKRDILDGVWRIAMDSLQKERASLNQANATIAQLKGQMGKADDKVKQADASIAKSEYERSHLAVFGIPMAKTFFVTFMVILVLGLLIGLLTVVASLRVLRKSVKDKDATIHGLTSEFEEFRKKALQKEMKISRELQDERNKIAAMRTS